MTLSSCAVCAEHLHGPDLVHCPSCASPHHADCWIYSRRCSTYSCSSRTARAPASGIRPSWYGDTVMPYRQILGLEEPLETTCPVCSGGWKEEAAARCSGCGEDYHEACWQGGGGCLRLDCPQPAKGKPKAA